MAQRALIPYLNVGAQPRRPKATWWDTRHEVYIEFDFSMFPGGFPKLNAKAEKNEVTIEIGYPQDIIEVKPSRDIVPTASKYTRRNAVLQCCLRKASPGIPWKRLVKGNNASEFSWIRRDMNKRMWATDTKDQEIAKAFNVSTDVIKVKKITVTGRIGKKAICSDYNYCMSYSIFPVKWKAKLTLDQPCNKNVTVGWVQGLTHMDNEAKYEDLSSQNLGGTMIVDCSEKIFDSSGDALPWLNWNSFVDLQRVKTIYTIESLDTATGKFDYFDPVEAGDTENKNIRLKSVYEANKNTAFLIAIDNDKLEDTQLLWKVQWKFETDIDVEYIGDKHKFTETTRVGILGLDRELCCGVGGLSLEDLQPRGQSISTTANNNFRQFWYPHNSDDLIDITTKVGMTPEGPEGTGVKPVGKKVVQEFLTSDYDFEFKERVAIRPKSNQANWLDLDINLED